MVQKLDAFSRNHPSNFDILLKIYFYLKGNVREGNRDFPSTGSQIATMFGADPAQSQEPAASSGLPCAFRPSSAAFRGQKQGARWEVEQSGLHPEFIWDVGTAAKGLAFYAVALVCQLLNFYHFLG